MAKNVNKHFSLQEISQKFVKFSFKTKKIIFKYQRTFPLNNSPSIAANCIEVSETCVNVFHYVTSANLSGVLFEIRAP